MGIRGYCVECRNPLVALRLGVRGPEKYCSRRCKNRAGGRLRSPGSSNKARRERTRSERYFRFREWDKEQTTYNSCAVCETRLPIPKDGSWSFRRYCSIKCRNKAEWIRKKAAGKPNNVARTRRRALAARVEFAE